MMARTGAHGAAAQKALVFFLMAGLILGFTLVAPQALAAGADDSAASSGSMPVYTLGESGDAGAVSGDTTISVSAGGALDNDALFDGYVERLFASKIPGNEETAGLKTQYASSLSGANLSLYNALEGMVNDVAAGKTTSTVLTVSAASIMGVASPTFDEAQAAAGSISLDAVILRLCAEHPYELYWFDRPGDTTFAISASGRPSVPYFTLSMPVAKGYAAAANTVDTSAVTRAKNAVKKAQAIVSKYASKSAYDRLVAYKNEICSLTAYDKAAASSSAYGDPQQLVNVFDGDTSTKSVCEGYAKAFQYLCDLSNDLSKNSGVTCRTVTGKMSGGTGAGDHMWNIVKMPDGKTYLADVTNSDAGAIGSSGQLFLVPMKGSVSAGYTNSIGSTAMKYTYDNDAKALYSSSELTVASNSLAGASVGSISSVVYAAKAFKPSPKVKLGYHTLVKGTDYTITYANNKNVGTATVTITGKNGYSGSIKKTFKITKAKNPMVVKTAKKTVKLAKVKKKAQVVTSLAVTKAQGTKKYSKVSGSKYLKVNAKTGKVTVKKGTPKGTYSIKIKVKAAGNKNYKAATKTITAKVVVKK